MFSIGMLKFFFENLALIIRTKQENVAPSKQIHHYILSIFVFGQKQITQT